MKMPKSLQLLIHSSPLALGILLSYIFWRSNSLLLGIYLVAVFALILLGRDRKVEFLIAIYGIIAGFIIEVIGTQISGYQNFTQSDFLGIPAWLLIAWGYGFVLMKRISLLIATDSPWTITGSSYPTSPHGGNLWIRTKRRQVVKWLDELSKDPSQPSAYSRSGIPRDIFEAFLTQKAFIRPDGLPNRKTYWDAKELKQYISYCIQDGFLIQGPFGELKLSSLGEKYLNPSYYFLKFANHWATQHIITLLIGAVLGLLLASLGSKVGVQLP